MPRYRMLGSQNPGDRIDRVVDGAKTIEVGGDPVSLTDAQYQRVSRFARLELVDSSGEEITAEDALQSAEESRSGAAPRQTKPENSKES
jgi:hypothetical protein